MRITIDRLEEGYAVVETEDGSIADMPLSLLPPGAGEGSILDILLNSERTMDREEEMRNKMNSLFR